MNKNVPTTALALIVAVFGLAAPAHGAISLKKAKAKAWSTVLRTADQLEEDGAAWAKGYVRTCFRISPIKALCRGGMNYKWGTGAPANCWIDMKLIQSGSGRVSIYDIQSGCD